MHVLVAEDDTSIAKIAALALERIGGHTVNHASDGLAALEACKTQKFDLILLDGMMPKLDGMSACKRLRDELGVEAPIIFLSAKSQECEIKQALEAGASGYILKPFDPKNLNQQINAILENLTQKGLTA